MYKLLQDNLQTTVRRKRLFCLQLVFMSIEKPVGGDAALQRFADPRVFLVDPISIILYLCLYSQSEH